MCPKHVEAWNILTVKQKLCASSWLLRCTVRKTSKFSYMFWPYEVINRLTFRTYEKKPKNVAAWIHYKVVFDGHFFIPYFIVHHNRVHNFKIIIPLHSPLCQKETKWALSFSCRCLWTSLPFGMWRRVVCYLCTEDSEWCAVRVVHLLWQWREQVSLKRLYICAVFCFVICPNSMSIILKNKRQNCGAT